MPGRLIIVAGFPGAGKTTVSTRLAQHYGFTLLHQDLVRRAIRDSEGAGNVGNHQAAYLSMDVLAAICHANLRLGGTLILDAALGFPSLWALFSRVCEETDAEMLAFVLDVPFEVSQARVGARWGMGDERHDLQPHDLEAHRPKLDHFHTLAYPHHGIDATQPLDTVVAEIVDIIDAQLTL